MVNKEKFKVICPKCSSENTGIYFDFIHEEIVCNCRDCGYDDSSDYEKQSKECELKAEKIMKELGLEVRED